MAAHQLNVADLRALLQKALDEQGESLDPTGYAYVTVDEGSNYAAFESQDPLASEQNTLLVENEPMEGDSEGEIPVAGDKDSMFLYGLSLQPNGSKQNASPIVNVIMEDAFDSIGEGKSAPGTDPHDCSERGLVESSTAIKSGPSLQPHSSKQVTSPTVDVVMNDQTSLLARPDNTFPLASPLESIEPIAESKSIPETDPNDWSERGSAESRQKSAKPTEVHDPVPVKVNEKQLNVLELRAMLQAALEHQEGRLNTPGCSQIPENIVHTVTHELQDSIAPECKTAASFDINPSEFQEKQRTSEFKKTDSIHTGDCNTSCDGLRIQSDARSDGTQNRFEGETNAVVIEIVPNNDSINVLGNESQISWFSQDPRNSDLDKKYQLLEKQYKQLSEQHKKLKQKYSKLEQEKLSSDDYALRLGKELQQLKDKQKIPQAKFTEEEGIAITVAELEEVNERADSDSMFVGLLSTRLIGSGRLETMSVTGQASHRFAKLKKPDGTPQYPATEKIDPGILEFICNKVAERTAIKVGPENAVTIRKRSDMPVVKKYIGQKIGNLKKAATVRKVHNGTVMQDAGNIRV